MDVQAHTGDNTHDSLDYILKISERFSSTTTTGNDLQDCERYVIDAGFASDNARFVDDLINNLIQYGMDFRNATAFAWAAGEIVQNSQVHGFDSQKGRMFEVYSIYTTKAVYVLSESRGKPIDIEKMRSDILKRGYLDKKSGGLGMRAVYDICDLIAFPSLNEGYNDLFIARLIAQDNRSQNI